MKVLIVGAGIAGLSAGIFAEQKGIKTTIVEMMPTASNAGYTLLFHANGTEMLKKLDVWNSINKKAEDFAIYDIRDKNENLVLSINFNELENKYGDSVIVKRPDLQDILLKKYGKEKVKYGTTIKNIIENTSNVLVEFTNGESENFDLVIGADGVNSFVRNRYFSTGDSEYYDWFSFLCWVDASKIKNKNIQHFIDKDRYFLLYPFNENECAAYFAIKPKKDDHKSLGLDLLKQYFSEFKTAKHILRNIDPNIAFYRGNIKKSRNEEWFRGRVVLIGDAAHAVSPILGMGSTLAMQDAYVLFDELGKSKSIETDLLNFAHRRNPVVHKITKTSNSVMMLMNLSNFWTLSMFRFMPKFLKEIYVANLKRTLNKLLEIEC